MTDQEIKKIFRDTPRDETVFIIFKEDNIARNQKELYSTPVECFWTIKYNWGFISRWDNKTTYQINTKTIEMVVTKEENPEYFL